MRKSPEPRRLCRAPGCGAPLHSKNRHGLCVDHQHAKGLCLCAKCRPDLDVEEPPRNPRLVTLPRAPWEVRT